MELDKYRIEYSKDVLKKDIPKLDASIRKLIKKAIDTKLIANPMLYGKPMSYAFSGQRALRVGNYRVIYKIDDKNKIVTIEAIGHRRNSYDL